MKIAIFCTNLYKTPPSDKDVVHAPLWITHQITEGLVRKGHKVYLFSAGGSKTKATRIISLNLPCLDENKEWGSALTKLIQKEKMISKGKQQFMGSLKWKEVLRENYELLLVSKLTEMSQKGMFDVVQFHSPLRALHFAPLIKVPVFFTMHDPMSHPFDSYSVRAICRGFKNIKNIKFISISKAQRKPAPGLNWAQTVYNGTDTNKFKYSGKDGGYLAFAGRIVPQKGLHIAVKVAKKTNKRLKIAGPVNLEHNSYWNKQIKPYLSNKITYEGMLSKKKLVSFYQKAEALLMPILWEESFGLVMTEAMSCGTPVIAFNKGSVKEVVKHNKTGFIVNNAREMVKAVKKINKIKRADCRKWVENNFSLERMVDNYEKLYLKALKYKKH